MLQDFSSNAELRLHASNTEDVGSISSQRAKIPHVTGQKKKKKILQWGNKGERPVSTKDTALGNALVDKFAEAAGWASKPDRLSSVHMISLVKFIAQ